LGVTELPELLERFRRGPELLATILTGVKPEEEDFAPGPDKWTIRQIAAHLADAELMGAARFRLVIAEQDPTLTAYDQEAWARNLGYTARKLKNSLETFRRLRAENHELLRSLPEGAWERAGNHTENGRVTLRMLLEGYTQHAENHARQIQAIRESRRAPR
jgi:hypothetical protein